jgi:hypothetical protein
MSNLLGDQVKVRIRVNKTAGTYRVEILDSGEGLSCADTDASGNSLHAKIVEAISERMSGNPATAELTREGEKEVAMHERQQRTNPIVQEEEEDEGYNPLNETDSNKQYDAGYGV